MSLSEWARNNVPQIDALLLKHGAVLFRDFEVAGIDGFNACVDAISGGAVEYVFRASPRTQIDGRYNIYTSTDYPANERIFPHNEHAYSPVFPLQLYFYCHTPATSGGETPIGDGRLIFSRIRADVRERFVSRGIMYVRNYGDGLGLPWQTVFQTQDKTEVESYCRQVGIETEWKTGNRLRTRQVGPAVMKHPVTQQPVWFNHATFFHALTLPESIREELFNRCAPDELPQCTFYGDGGVIYPDDIYHLQKIYMDSLVEFVWREGDVLLLDNMLTVHGRNAFKGNRRIMTAMAQPQRSVCLGLQEISIHG